ncbi:metallophosphoesterase [Crocinitomix catalasitica]|nr:metallophosphoesterase [Crocinitomix catalasitica]
MSRFVIFLIIVILVLAALELYAYYGLKSRWNNWSPWLRMTARISFFTLLGISVSSLIIMFGFGGFGKVLRNFFFAFVMINLFTKLVFCIFLLGDDGRRLFIWIKESFGTSTRAAGEGISRSDFMLKAGMAAAAIPLVSYTYGMISGAYNYKVRKETVKLPNLPQSFDGLKIVQISDIHSGSFYDYDAVNRGVDMILEQNADVIFFTGDLVNDSADEMDDYMDIFSRLEAPMGVFSIFGNHDYGDYRTWESEEAKAKNFERLKEVHAELGWRLLLDEHVYLERGKDKICLIGVENWGAGFHQHGDLAKAYQGSEGPVKLLLSHDPTHWDEQVRKYYQDIDITFSGHTHGAQMGIETGGFKWSPISLRYKKWAGLYQEENQYLYVNRGYGFIGYPGRIGILPEITVMEIVS